MCGIAGIIGPGTNESALEAMLISQNHRGPDATGTYIDPGHAALGHNRLSIIDLSDDANQPFFDASGRYCLVFNGEIYNYLELREALPDYEYRTQCDTEVLLAAYIHWGPDCLHRFNGMFSFAVWDLRDKSLFAARDRFGVKPFNYHFGDDRFYFSSEIKALFAAGVAQVPNEKTWASYFAYGSYGMPDETFWERISQLPAGHRLEFSNGNLNIEKWYRFEEAVAQQPRGLSYVEAKEHYVRLLKDSIRLRFRADVPVGFNISGGLDSSVLLAMVNNFTHGSKNINAFTFYTGDARYDELEWVQMMLSHTQNPLTKIRLDWHEVPALAAFTAMHQDEPFGGIPTLAYCEIFRKAREQGVIVLLDGQGMDEQWAGYDYYTAKSGEIIQGVSQSPFRPGALSKAFLAKAEKTSYPKPFGDDLLNMQFRDLFYTKIPRALRFNDRISMAHSTELREPFLDHRLVEFAFSLPADYKIRDGVTKVMLREIAAEYLSNELVFAPKRPLQTPQREWLAGELREFAQAQIGKIAESPYAHWFDLGALASEWKKYGDGDRQSSFHIWQWIGLGLQCGASAKAANKATD